MKQRRLRGAPTREVPTTSPAEAACVASDGARARAVLRDDGRTALVIESPKGEALVEYDPANGRLVLRASQGLTVDAGDGPLTLRGRSVAVESDSEVDVRARRAVRLDAGEGDGEHGRVTVERGTVRAAAKAVAVDALRATLTFDEAAVAARVLRAAVRAVTVQAGAVETRADRVLTRAKDLYQEVEGTAQTRARALRMVAQGTLQALADRVLVRADDDVKVQGERVHLG